MNAPGDNHSPAAKALTPWATVAAVFAIALLVRTGAVMAQFSSLTDDPDTYRRLAITWRTTGVFGFSDETQKPHAVRPTAYRPPLYPLLLSILVHRGAVAGVAVATLHVLLGATTVTLAYWLAWRADLGRWALLTAAFTACDPILLRQAALVMTETLAAFLAVVALAAVARFQGRPSLLAAAGVGCVLGLAVLCRPTFLAWLLLIAGVFLLWPNRPRRIVQTAVLLAVAVAVLAPWTIRNMDHFGRPIFTTTHGGYTFWLANNDLYYDHLLRGEGRPFDAALLFPRLKELTAGHEHDEVYLDRALYQEAIATVRRRPLDFAYSCAARIANLWRLTPRAVLESESTVRTLARMAVGVWYAVMFGLATAGVIARRRRLTAAPWLGAVLLCVSLTCVHTLFWTDMRMRGPLMPAASLLAAAGAAWLTQRSSSLISST